MLDVTCRVRFHTLLHGMLLCVVGSCFAKLETGQATCKRSQQLPTISGVVVVSCRPKSLRPFALGLKASFH